MSKQSLSDFPRLAGARQPPCPCPRGDFHGTASRRLAQVPTASLIHIPVDGEEQITIRALSPSASGALRLGSPGPSHHLLLCDPALGLALGKGRWPALLGICPAPLGTHPALWETRPALLGTRPVLLGRCPVLLGTCPVPQPNACCAPRSQSGSASPARNRAVHAHKHLYAHMRVWVHARTHVHMQCQLAQPWHNCQHCLASAGDSRAAWNPAVLWEPRCGGTEPCQDAGGRQAGACWMQ